MSKIALILGASGQDGSYLGEFLLEKDYRVVGVRRRSSAGSLWRLQKCLENKNYELVEGDITDYSSILNLLSYYKPDEIYNLAAQSNVGTSFNQPINTLRVCSEGVLNLLEAIKFLKMPIRLYQASSSEMFGSSTSNYNNNKTNRLNFKSGSPKILLPDSFQDENTPFNPQSPYGIAKLAAHNMVKLYREAYGIYAVGGILFNHESPRRGINFVTRKIISWFFNNSYFMSQYYSKPGWHISADNRKLKLGNIDSSRDWGYAPEYVEAMWLMLQQSSPKDYIIGTGETHTIREFLDEAVQLWYKGNEDYKSFLEIDDNFKRPAEVPYLRADATLAKKELGWEPRTKFADLVRIMCEKENGKE
jgi:GDPmannose 4,6-dehydratase